MITIELSELIDLDGGEYFLNESPNPPSYAGDNRVSSGGEDNIEKPPIIQ